MSLQLLGGTYYLDQTVKLNQAKDSFLDISAYNGAFVTISGGRELKSGWEEEGSVRTTTFEGEAIFYFDNVTALKRFLCRGLAGQLASRPSSKSEHGVGSQPLCGERPVAQDHRPAGGDPHLHKELDPLLPKLPGLGQAWLRLVQRGGGGVGRPGADQGACLPLLGGRVRSCGKRDNS